jgi:hypothetical protein
VRYRATIEVYIDDESSGTTQIRKDILDPSKYRLEIHDDVHRITSAPNVVACALAHEFGHFIAGVCEFPASRKDPRMFLGGEPEKYPQAVINAENEAWDIAEMMFSLRQTRQESVASYEQALGLKQIPFEEFK